MEFSYFCDKCERTFNYMGLVGHLNAQYVWLWCPMCGKEYLLLQNPPIMNEQIEELIQCIKDGILEYYCYYYEFP